MNLQIKRVIVKYNEKNVGFLEELSNGKIAFQYDEGWLKEGFSISPMTLPLRDTVFIAKNIHFDGLFGVFQDALPDGWGELLMRRFLSKKGINFDRLSPLTKLSLVQDNGLGALSFYPNRNKTTLIWMIYLKKLAELLMGTLPMKV